MVFEYYTRLTRHQQKIYRHSDEVSSIRLRQLSKLRPLVQSLAAALEAESRPAIARACRDLASALTGGLELPPVRVSVLARRPKKDWGELHGLYEPAKGRRRAHVSVWMRTAKREQVVAFRTFLRTLLHELCHHLDYELLKLEDSFHTQGFYQRESSLFQQLVSDNKT